MIVDANLHQIVRNIAVDLLRKSSLWSSDTILEAAGRAAKAGNGLGVAVDVDLLAAELRLLFSVSNDDATILESHDPREHVPWLPDRKGQIEWRFWRRYITFIDRDFGMAPSSVNALDEVTDMVLSRLEDPGRDGPWDRRGMVVGSVQSGKTANYTGLICKAVDAGYKLIIVLAGIHSNLRSQTQLRIDEGVLGFDTQKSRALKNDTPKIGVGKYSPGETLHIHSLTSSEEEGDFNKRVAGTANIMLGSDPVVLVVKKNSRLLGNLLQWVTPPGQKTIRDVPLLLIDDEADNASIDTGPKKGKAQSGEQVTAINGKIRSLLKVFDKAAYVGYTATPFANIFINPEAQTDRHGDDIFPRSFIVNVKPPSNYVGPTRVFGLAADPDAGLSGQPSLPIVQQIDDTAAPGRFPPRHKKDHVPTELPPSLRRAVRCFILACAVRRARGQVTKHNSMLVHVTRFTDVQEKVVQLVRDELLPLQRRLQFGDGARAPTLRDELRDLWEADFVPTSAGMKADAGAPMTWTQVEAELVSAASKITVMPINGMAGEVLDYKTHEAEGLSVIAIGGDKLSRGLTLEGLSVSYFLRTSRMYDTLMQMGRWFGYRPGYLDVCRLFTTRQLVDWYRHIALAEVELRREFDYMVAAGRTPMQYGLRVRTHPGGMIITALNKMCHSQELKLSWSGVLAQTTHVPRDQGRVATNHAVTEQFLGALGQPESGEHLTTRIWSQVSAATVAGYLEELVFPPESARAAGKQVADFIRTQSTKASPELTVWTVALVSSRSGKPANIAGHEVGLVIRNPVESVTGDAFPLRNANIISPDHQALDLRQMPFTEQSVAEAAASDIIKKDVEEIGDGRWKTLEHLALAITANRIKQGRLKGNGQVANGQVIRELRPKQRGLLLIYPLNLAEHGIDLPVIGAALSFPASDTVDGVDYRVNRVWDTAVEDDATYEDEGDQEVPSSR
ncbi:MAG: Z1 domain-containing protein [Polyangiaceae bacterium]